MSDLQQPESEPITLALEHSTSTSSVALLRGTRLLAGRSWQESRVRNQQVFSILPELLREASVDADGIDLFAVGLGPGAFSGVRIALSAARGMALPDRKPVVGVCSAEALAYDLWQEQPAATIAVVGDARRERLWMAIYDRSRKGMALREPVALVTLEELRTRLPPSCAIATPDWERIGEALRTAASIDSRLVAERRGPRAETVGRLAAEKHARNDPPLPLTPIYLHPGVFAEPRHPTARL